LLFTFQFSFVCLDEDVLAAYLECLQMSFCALGLRTA